MAVVAVAPAATSKISKLSSAVASLSKISENEKSGFINLISRYLSGDEEQIEWSKIKTLTDEIVVSYDTLAPPPKDLEEMKKLLNKLAVLKLNGGLGTTMGCIGHKTLAQMVSHGEEELAVYDGADLKKKLLMPIKGQVYDVTQSRQSISV